MFNKMKEQNLVLSLATLYLKCDSFVTFCFTWILGHIRVYKTTQHKRQYNDVNNRKFTEKYVYKYTEYANRFPLLL